MNKEIIGKYSPKKFCAKTNWNLAYLCDQIPYSVLYTTTHIGLFISLVIKWHFFYEVAKFQSFPASRYNTKEAFLSIWNVHLDGGIQAT